MVQNPKEKSQILENQRFAICMYPEPGSNRHGLLHWCLRPARLPIPPSGLFASGRLGLARMLAASGRDRGNVSLGDPSGMLKVVDLLVRGAKIL